MASLGAAALGAPAPTLVMHEPEGMRSTLVTGSITALMHLAGVLVLVLVATLAPPELIPKIIPVETLRDITPVELRGSELEPAHTGPKSVGPLAPSTTATVVSQTLSPDQAEAVRQAALESARRAVQHRQLAARQGTSLPTQLDRREVSADRLAARAVAERPTAPIDLSAIEAVQIDPRELAAVRVDTSGPREIDTARVGDASALETLATLSALRAPEYVEAFSASDFDAARAAGIARSAESDGVGTDGSGGRPGDGQAGRDFGGGGSGGAGDVLGVARCMESAFVARYLEDLEARTVERWIVPDEIPPNMQVRLRFKLDVAGEVSEIEAVAVEDEPFASSARQALRAAAPFPPLDDDVRCIADKPLRATFDVPSD